jgi:hypothetical protein
MEARTYKVADADLKQIGKSLYEGSNEAKFNDYVLVGSSAAA